MRRGSEAKMMIVRDERSPHSQPKRKKMKLKRTNRIVRLLIAVITTPCLITATNPTGGDVLTTKMAMLMIQASADPKHIGEDRRQSHSTHFHRRRDMIVLSKNTKRGKKPNFKRMQRC